MDFRPKTIRNFLKEMSLIGNVSDKVSKFDSFVKRLEEEMKKIDAFKRELPLSMLLLNDAIVALKEESMQCVGRRNEPVLEEFLPLKENCNNQREEDCKNKNKNCNYVKDKKNWMSSVQLWNTDEFDDKQSDTKKNNEDLKSRGKKVKGFSPFEANSSLVVKKEEKGETLPVHGLTLLIPGIKNPKVESACIESRTSCSSTIASARANYRSGLSDHHHRQQQQQQQASRKQRRCWSSELHRRFVNALQQLGGSQAATPKQIRELMQVDGLTNDEVKSHLQKYRLHSRRNPSSTTASADQSTIVLGNGRWMSRDQYGDSSKASSSQSGSPQGPLQLATNTGGTSTTGGDSTEDDEDMRSEAYSWKSRMHKPGKDYV